MREPVRRSMSDDKDLAALDAAISRVMAVLSGGKVDSGTRAMLEEELRIVTEMRLEISRKAGSGGISRDVSGTMADGRGASRVRQPRAG
jgi:hypothetical protein